jgi:hypothetical protein
LVVAGSDDDVFTLFDNDWAPSSAASCAVREGGLDLSEELGAFAFAHAARTAVVDCGPSNAGAAGWSIGAIEVD